jgi:deoxyribonuclease V
MHDWDVTTDRAREIQRELRNELEQTPLAGEIDRVAGADISFERGSDQVYAAVVVLEVDTCEVVATARAVGEAVFPYVPTYLSFREAPFVLEAYRRLDETPDLLVCDGHGLAHPRRFGLASHVGVLLDDVPTVGCAKNVLVGEWGDLPAEKGSSVPLVHEGEVVGRAVRTRDETNPVFVSVGHRVTLEEAVDEILRVSPTYKIPEPIRAAHREVNEMRADG